MANQIPKPFSTDSTGPLLVLPDPADLPEEITLGEFDDVFQPWEMISKFGNYVVNDVGASIFNWVEAKKRGFERWKVIGAVSIFLITCGVLVSWAIIQ